LLEPFNLVSGKVPRYYQQIAIHRAIEAILLGQKRILATLATGTGKTCVAFQICWKLWNSRWNRTGEYRRPKILFLADRNILVDDPMAKMFAPFGDARHKIAGGDVSQSRDMYFGIYQALSTASEDVFRQYRPDFFDLIIIDECHRGSSRDESSWRAVLDYFEPAVQFGMTATPLREESRDSYEYFGNPVYTYSLRQGIEDGFLAPYRVHRVITTVDAAGWRPSKDELDRLAVRCPTRNTRPRISSASSRCVHAPGHGQTSHRFPERHRPLRQDPGVLRRSGARRRNATGTAQPE
jgi:type I restriction enzyme R subunit